MSLEDAIRKRSERIAALRKSCAEILERSKNITLEIGCGKGHYLSEYAATFKDEICVGIDLISERISDSRRRAKNKNADNAYFVKAEAEEFLESMPQDARLNKVMIFFPDPWPKARHHKRRLMKKEFLDYLRQFAQAGTKLYFRTDHAEYFEWTTDVINANENWEITGETILPIEVVSQFQRILPEFSTLVARAI